MIETVGKTHFVRIPRDNIVNTRFIRANGNGETLESMYARLNPKPTLLFNANFFSFADGWTTVALKVDGKIVRPTSAKSTGYIIAGRGATINFITMNGRPFEELTRDYDWAFESSPLLLPSLVANGIAASIVNSANPRTALGWCGAKNEWHLAVTDGRSTGYNGLTCRALADEMKRIGAEVAINLDGGGSTKALYNGKPINNQSEKRPIAGAIAIYLAEEITKNPDPVPTKKTRFIIDAGHGPETPGKRSPDSSGLLREFHFNLPVANKVIAKLNEYEGVEILTTHATNTDVPLADRVQKIVDWGKADAIVSIHANAFGSTWNTANGIETFTTTDKNAESVRLAGAIQSEMLKATGIRDRGVKEADFMIIYGNSSKKQYLRDYVPARILVECGFMTNVEEANLLKTEAYQEKCAEAIVKGLVDVYKLKKKLIPETPTSNNLYRVQVGAFSIKSNAEKLAEELRRLGYQTLIKEELK